MILKLNLGASYDYGKALGSNPIICIPCGLPYIFGLLSHLQRNTKPRKNILNLGEIMLKGPKILVGFFLRGLLLNWVRQYLKTLDQLGTWILDSNQHLGSALW